MRPEDSSTPIHLVIDLPNVIYRDKVPTDFSFSALLGYIAEKEIGGRPLLGAHLYGFKYAEDAGKMPLWKRNFNAIYEKIAGAQATIHGRLVDLHETRRFKDVDMWIVDNLWRSCVNAEHVGLLRIRHILVSGDADFLKMYRRMQRMFRGKLNMELGIYTWKENFTRQYRALPQSIRYLEDIPGINDPSVIAPP